MAKATLIRGKVIRVTRLDGCGNPVLGPDSVIVTSGFISVQATPNNVTGTDISVTNANGDVCAQDTAQPKFNNFTLEIALCGVDPALVNLLTGQPLVYGAGNEPVGFRDNSRVKVDLTGFALEVWTGVAGDACEGGDGSYGYFLYPFVKGGSVGALTVQNNSVDFTISGATTKEGSGWDQGPYDVVGDGDGGSQPLVDGITDGDHRHFEITSIAPPEDTDGTAALGVPATGAVAGTPGYFTAPGAALAYAPETLAALQSLEPGFTESPTTAWVAGTSVILRDGTRAHWTGTAWAAGPA